MNSGKVEPATAGASDNPTKYRRSQQSHAAILDAAIELLHDGGYSRLTIHAVAARAQVGKATIYRWWPSKTALVMEAIAAHPPPVAVEATGDLRVDLGAMLRSALDSLTNSPLGQTVLAIAVEQLRDSEPNTQLEVLLHAHRDVLSASLRQAVARGELPSEVDADLITDVLLGTLLHRALIGRTSAEATVDQLLGLLLNGQLPLLLPPGNSTPS